MSVSSPLSSSVCGYNYAGMLQMLVFGYITCVAGSVAFCSIQGVGPLLPASLGLAYFGEEIANVLAMTFVISSFPARLRGRGGSLAAIPSCFAGAAAGLLAATPELAFNHSGSAMLAAAAVQILRAVVRMKSAIKDKDT